MTFDELWGRSTPNSWARVPRGPAAVAVGAFLFGSTGVLAAPIFAGVSLATIGGFLVTTAVTSWALSALTPKPPGTSSQTLGNVKEAVGDFDIVYGEVRKGGTVTFMETSDRYGYKVFKDDYLHMIIVLAGHEVEEIGDVYFNDEKLTLDSEGFATGDRWLSRARVKKHLGSPNQLADPDLVAETSVDSNFRGRGIAYLYVRLDWDGNVFGNGIPIITAMVKGRKVYDPRSGTRVWTDNAALCIRDYLEQPFGLNSIQSPASLSSSDWVVAANVCDIQVTKKDNTTEKRYALNGVVSTANTPRTNLQNMLTSCGGTLFWGQGQWQFKVGYFPSGPYVSFNSDDLRSGINLVTKNSRKENFNAVSGTFLDKEQDYIEVDYPKVESTVFLERDNNQTNILDMSLPYTTSSSTAQRLAKMAMFRSREEIIIAADFGLKAARTKVGDVVQFTFDRYGFNNKYFEVISWKPTTDGGELKINLILRETSAAAYDWNAEERDIIGNDTNLPDPTAGLIVRNLSVTNRQTLQSDGSLLGEVVLSWDAADSAFIDKYIVQWRNSNDISWSATETDEVSLVIPSVQSGVNYDYRVRAVNFAGFSGPWEQLTTLVDGKETPPGIPTNLQTKNLYKAVEVTWTNPTDRDFNHVEIWGSATNAIGSAVLLGKSGGTKFIFNMEPMEEKWFFVRAVDNSNNKSAFTTGVMGTALFIDQSDVNIDVGQLLDDAGLNAVEVLPNLPTSNNYDGRTVYNTEDRQLYIYDGVTGTWRPAVEPFNPDDLVLDGDNFPSDLKPVEVLSSLPTTGNFEGRVVMLLSDGKLYRYHSGSWTASVPTNDLTGQIVSAQINDGAISAVKLASNAVTAVKIASGAVETSKIATGAVTGNKISNNAVTETKILDGSISTPKITTNAITSDKIVANAVTTAKIDALAITAGKIATGAIVSDKIQAGAVGADQIAANAIVASKIGIGDFTNLVPDSSFQDVNIWKMGSSIPSNLGGVYVTSPSNWGDGVTGSIWSNYLDSTTGWGILAWTQDNKVPVSGGREYFYRYSMRRFNSGTGRGRMAVWFYKPDGSPNGSVGLGFITTDSMTPQVTEGSFVVPTETSEMRVGFQYDSSYSSGVIFRSAEIREKNAGLLIVDGAIKTNLLDAGAVTADKIEANAITAGKISAGAVATDKIASYAITSVKIAAEAVTAGRIAANSITTSHLVSNSVTAGIIAAGAVSAAAIQSGAVTADKINVNSLSAISANLGTIQVGSANIANGAITNAKIGNAAVDTLKIANNALYVPYRYTRADAYVTRAYYQSNKLTIVNRNVTDFEGGAFNVAFNAYIDALSVDDNFGGFDLLINDTVVQSVKAGIRTSGGAAIYIMPVSLSANGFGSSSVNIKVRAWSIDYANHTSPKENYYLRDISLTVSGARR